MSGESSGGGWWRRLVVGLVVVAVVTAGFSSVAGAESQAECDRNLFGDVEFPSITTVGEEWGVSGSRELEDRIGDPGADLNVTLYVDGEEQGSFDQTVKFDGRTIEYDLTHTFEEEGSHDVKIAIRISVDGHGRTWCGSVAIDVGSGATVEGAAFPVPKSLQDDIDDVRSEYDRIDPGHDAFVLAEEGQIYVVVAEGGREKGLASVSGYNLTTARTSELFDTELEYGVILASNVSIQTEGTPTSVPEVDDENRFDLVRIDASHRRVSSLRRYNDSGVEFAISAGVLVEDPPSADDIYDGPGTDAAELTVGQSPEVTAGDGFDVDDRMESLLGELQKDRLYTVDFETRFWTDGEAVVDAVVLPSGSIAREFVSRYDEGRIVRDDTAKPILYVVDERREYDSYDEVEQVNQAAYGDLVEVEASVFGRKASVQESLENVTACGNEKVDIPTGPGTSCVTLNQDALVHSGVAWTSLPEDSDDVLPVAGISSHYLDEESNVMNANYRIRGEVVSTDRFHESLPGGKMLMIYDLEWEGESDYAALPGEVRERIEDRFVPVSGSLERQVSESVTSWFDVRITDTNAPVTAGEELEVTVEIENTGAKSDSQEVTLAADGAGVDLVDVSLAPGETTTETFTYETETGNVPAVDLEVESRNDAAVHDRASSTRVENGTVSPEDPDHYSLAVGANAEEVVVEVGGGSGADLDLYVTLDGREASATDYDRASTDSGSQERIQIDADAVTEIGVAVTAYGGTADYELRMVQETSDVQDFPIVTQEMGHIQSMFLRDDENRHTVDLHSDTEYVVVDMEGPEDSMFCTWGTCTDFDLYAQVDEKPSETYLEVDGAAGDTKETRRLRVGDGADELHILVHADSGGGAYDLRIIQKDEVPDDAPRECGIFFCW